jgi:molybdopterin-synthase adenylyltransferase
MEGELESELRAHLLRKDGQEDICFALWYPSAGAGRTTALLAEAVWPDEGERHVHGNASFEARYFLRTAQLASERRAGIALLHSHPGRDSRGWQGMSPDDVDAERGHAAQALVVTGLPLAGLTLAGDNTWSARLWPKAAPREYVRESCENVRIVGHQLAVSYNPELLPVPRPNEALSRTVSAWGDEAQSNLARLHVGIVGLGSVGSMVAESLARMGVERITLLDFDRIQRHNLDRCLHAGADDVGLPKVEVARRGLKVSATAAQPVIEAQRWSVVEEDGFRVALDCDVLFSCVDRPWPRAVLNLIAYAHLVPVVDGGIAVEASPRGLRRAHWKAHIAAPGRRCLECNGQFDPGLVQAEREGRLDDPRYIEGLPDGHPLKSNENVFPFSMNVASLEVLQFIRMVIAPLGMADVGGEDYQFVQARHRRDAAGCEPTCWYSRQYQARGDTVGFSVTGRHPVAEAARKD